MMTEDNGWRLTAYALGELNDEEREAVELWLAGQPEARAEVEAIRATAAALTEALGDEAMPGLLPVQRAAVLRGVAADGSTVAGGEAAPGGGAAGARVAVAANDEGRRGLRLAGGLLAVAAAALVAVGLWRVGAQAPPSGGQDVVATVEAPPEPQEVAGAEVEAPSEPEAPGDAGGEVAAMDEATRLARAQAAGYREAPPYDGAAVAKDEAGGAEQVAERKSELDAPPPKYKEAAEPSAATARPPRTATARASASPADEGRSRALRGDKDLADGAGAMAQPERTAAAEAPRRAAPGGSVADAPPVVAGLPKAPVSRAPRAKNAAGPEAVASVDSFMKKGASRPLGNEAGEAQADPRGVAGLADGSARRQLGASSGEGVGGGGRGVARPKSDAAGVAAPLALARPRDAAPRRREARVTEARPFPGEPVEAPEAESPSESYDPIAEHPFRRTASEPLSTFSVDVDTASFTNVRRFLDRGELPPRDAVRIEEIVNWFPYGDPAPQGGGPFALRAEVAPCPWNGENQLVRIALKAREVTPAQRPRANLVFLVDVSGSMQRAEKLPLLKQALTMLTRELDGGDTVAIVAYSGGAGVVLEPTSGADKATILGRLSNLRAGGSTNGSAGIALAYQIARRVLVPGGTNRVILATDGDFNVGTTDRRALEAQIAQEAATGIYLTVLGFGTGNLQDGRLEALSNRGNGQYAYIDSAAEAWRVLVQQMESTLVAVAKDVKLQVEFDPAQVAAWRLVGYEDRAMANWEFNDDRRDAGDMGAGHAVNALYELIPQREDRPHAGGLRYAPQPALVAHGEAPDGAVELLTVSVRYKAPTGEISHRLDLPVMDYGLGLAQVSTDFRFAAAAATFGMLLRRSPYAAGATFGLIDELAGDLGGGGDRSELLRLATIARGLLAR
jgi:Ca-activated chloride channel family protein